jgi:hypothetical protein
VLCVCGLFARESADCSFINACVDHASCMVAVGGSSKLRKSARRYLDVDGDLPPRV